jgi:hypothetical protein
MSVNKYQNSKIYKIVSDKTDKIYIGSTTEKYLSNRLAGHVTCYKRYKEGKSKAYVSSFKLLELESYEIILIEVFPCNSRAELCAREYFYIKQYGNITVNETKPTKTEEDIKKHKERIKDAKINRFYYCECGVYRLNHDWSRHEMGIDHKKAMIKLARKADYLAEYLNSKKLDEVTESSDNNKLDEVTN